MRDTWEFIKELTTNHTFRGVLLVVFILSALVTYIGCNMMVASIKERLGG